MKRFAFSTAVVVGLFLVNSTFAQGFRVPANYAFDSKDSYHKYDKDIIRFANWLEKVAPGDEEGNVKRGGRFFGEWLSGCSYVQFRSNVRIDGMMSESRQYMLYYEAGWVRYALKNQPKPDKQQCAYAGLKMVLKVYAENRGQKKDANLDELLKLEDDGKLKSWVDDKTD